MILLLMVAYYDVIDICSVRSVQLLASMASSGTSAVVGSFVISNILNLVSIKLDRHNYLLWLS